MRKIMVIAALLGLGFAGVAKADKGAKIPVQIPEDKRVGDVIQPNLQIAHINDVWMGQEDREIAPGVIRSVCVVRVELELPDGTALQLEGDTRLGHGNGPLNPVNVPGLFTARAVEAGRFALVGRHAVALEIRGNHGLALFGLFRQNAVPGQSSLVQVVGTGWMVTNGHVLRDFKPDLSTRDASTQDLAGAFARAQSFPDPAQRAQQFLLEFVQPGEVPDVARTSACNINCNPRVGAVVPGAPGYGIYQGAPTGPIDPSLR